MIVAQKQNKTKQRSKKRIKGSEADSYIRGN